MRDERERLLDILEAIEQIERYINQGKETFKNDELIQTWVIHHIQIIGEASAKVSNVLRMTHTEIPWQKIIAMRNILVHAYFSVDLEEVWFSVESDLPDLKCKVKAILQELEGES
jgi:uncharacterized protein with HEPN domain